MASPSGRHGACRYRLISYRRHEKSMFQNLSRALLRTRIAWRESPVGPIALWAILLLSGPATVGAQQAPGTFVLEDFTGAELYQRFCASCHGESGRGDGPVASSLLVAVPDLTQISRRYGNRFPVEQLREIVDGRSNVIAHGTREMPVWGYEFWWEEGADIQAESAARAIIEELLAYLRTIQSDD